VAGVIGCRTGYRREGGLWGGDIALYGFFLRVVCWGEGRGCGWIWVWVRVCGFLRVVVVCGGEFCFGLVLVSCVCLLRRGRGIRWVLWMGLVRSCMRLVTYVSSSPVITYLRWDRESDSMCCWVSVSVGSRPWYMVVRLMRSMCMPLVHPSVCWGVIWIWVTGVSWWRSGGAIYSPEYR